MAIEAASMEQVRPGDRLILAEVGKEKSGKTRLLATAPKPVLHFDWDRRKQAIAGIKGVYSITLYDEGGTQAPTAYTDAIRVQTALEQSMQVSYSAPNEVAQKRPPNLQAVGKAIGQTWPDLPIATIADDSIASLANCAMRYALASTGDIRRVIPVPGQAIYVTKSFDGWNAEMNMVEGIVMRRLALGTNYIITMHEQDEEAPDSSAEKPRYTGRVDVFPGRYRRVLRYFNEVWRVTRDQMGPKIQVMPDYQFLAATALQMPNPIPFDIEKILASQPK